MRSRLAFLIFLATCMPIRPAVAGGSPTGDRQPAIAAVAGAPERLLGLVNGERNSAGLAPLEIAADAASIADDWSRRMASAGAIGHNQGYLDEPSMRRLNATLVGENVAVADGLDEIHDMLMRSPRHRDNILEPRFRLVGFGAVQVEGGQIYVTQDFLTRQAEPHAPRRRPAPGPRTSPAPRRANLGREPGPRAGRAARPAPAAPSPVAPAVPASPARQAPPPGQAPAAQPAPAAGAEALPPGASPPAAGTGTATVSGPAAGTVRFAAAGSRPSAGEAVRTEDLVTGAAVLALLGGRRRSRARR
jgi:Cysteine-rich secretory protein family